MLDKLIIIEGDKDYQCSTFEEIVKYLINENYYNLTKQEKENIIAVVSSDDDMIPMIFQENMLSDKIYHVLTLSEHGYFFSQFYDKIKPVNYKSVAW